jgi:hypothetical protein|tara:strand:+ start:1339 stop:1515 length:177 start_codon:yes stop_codon:yes gene_type:complete
MSEKRIAIILTKDEYEVVKKALQTYIKYDAGDMASQILGDIIKIKKVGGEVLNQAPLD